MICLGGRKEQCQNVPMFVRCQKMRLRRVKVGMGHNECARARQLRIRHCVIGTRGLATGDMRPRKVHVERNDTALDPGSGSDSRSGPSVLFTTTWHRPHHLESAQFQQPQAQQFPKPVGESRDQELEQGRPCLESAGIRPQRRGSGSCFTPCGDLPDGRERPDCTKDVPLTSEVRPQTSHYLKRKAMSEQIEGLPKSVEKNGKARTRF